MKEKCSICGKEYHSDFFIESPYIDKDVHICECCADDNLGKCFICNEWIDPEKSKYINYTHLCDDCYSKKVFTCSECGEKFYSNNNKPTICDSCNTKKAYIEFVKNIQFDKMISKEMSFCTLKKSTTTTLMSRLRHCYGYSPSKEYKSPFDILYITYSNKKYIVMWDVPSEFKQFCEYGCTMTEFKRNFPTYLQKTETCASMKMSDNQYIHVFERPFELRAQTDADKNYGNHFYWYGNNCVDEEYGNQYGDTSTFCILGYIEYS